MKVLLQSLGTRGDIEPFLALAEIISKRGWQVACNFPEQFRDATEKLGYKFYGLDRGFLELLEGQAGQAVMGGSGSFWKRIKNFFTLAKSGYKLQHKVISDQQQAVLHFKPDKILYHPKCVYPILWELATAGSTAMICPLPFIVHEVKEMSALTFSGNGNYGTFINGLTYKLLNGVRGLVFNRTLKKYQRDLPIPKINSKIISRCLLHQTKAVYTISPSLFPRPQYWPDHLQVSGYFERSGDSSWQPPEGLLEFIEQHPKILFITFGSMRNPHPQAKTAALLHVLEKHHITAIINTSWGGLEQPANCPANIFFVTNIPYSWIFPKIYAVMHHGGSGTTHTACKYGCASLIIPHIVDQYFWNNRLNHLGLGPKGIPIKKLNADNLEPLILDLMGNDSYKRKALEISNNMLSESQAEDLLNFLFP